VVKTELRVLNFKQVSKKFSEIGIPAWIQVGDLLIYEPSQTRRQTRRESGQNRLAMTKAHAKLEVRCFSTSLRKDCIAVVAAHYL
jgi:hypothetical protein